jgi:hypothetical protein
LWHKQGLQQASATQRQIGTVVEMMWELLARGSYGYSIFGASCSIAAAGSIVVAAAASLPRSIEQGVPVQVEMLEQGASS